MLTEQKRDRRALVDVGKGAVESERTRSSRAPRNSIETDPE
jgi:hypothetical protein